MCDMVGGHVFGRCSRPNKWLSALSKCITLTHSVTWYTHDARAERYRATSSQQVSAPDAMSLYVCCTAAPLFRCLLSCRLFYVITAEYLITPQSHTPHVNFKEVLVRIWVERLVHDRERVQPLHARLHTALLWTMWPLKLKMVPNWFTWITNRLQPRSATRGPSSNDDDANECDHHTEWGGFHYIKCILYTQSHPNFPTLPVNIAHIWTLKKQIIRQPKFWYLLC